MKKFIVCLLVFTLVGSANARNYYSDGAVHDLADMTSESLGIDNATTVNVGDGVTITLERETTYASTFVGLATTGGLSYLNLTGSGQILFGVEMGLAVSDGSGSSGSVSMSGTSYMNPVMLRFGLRGDGIFNISDDAMLEIRTDGELYPPQFNVAYYEDGHTSTINQSGNSIIQSLATGMDFGNGGTAIYNMSGGQLTLGGPINIAGADDAFNFTGGVISLLGGDYTDIVNNASFYAPNGVAASFDGVDTAIVVPEPMTLGLLGLGGLLLRRKR